MFAEYRESLERRDLAERTIRGYVRDLERFRVWFEADTGEALHEQTVSAMDAAAYRRYLLDRRASTATINRAMAAIRSWMRWAGNEEANRVRGIQETGRLAPQGLERRQVAALLRAARRGRHPRRDLALVVLLVETGLRIGEAAALRLTDLTINGRSGAVQVVAGKRRKTRTVPLNASARRALREWLEERGEVPGCDAVFISQKGGPLTKNAMQRVVAGLARDAGLVGVSAHTLRHTFAKNFLRETGDLVSLSKLLGHRRLDTTAIYLQPSLADLASDLENAALTG